MILSYSTCLKRYSSARFVYHGGSVDAGHGEVVRPAVEAQQETTDTSAQTEGAACDTVDGAGNRLKMVDGVCKVVATSENKPENKDSPGKIHDRISAWQEFGRQLKDKFGGAFSSSANMAAIQSAYQAIEDSHSQSTTSDRFSSAIDSGNFDTEAKLTAAMGPLKAAIDTARRGTFSDTKWSEIAGDNGKFRLWLGHEISNEKGSVDRSETLDPASRNRVNLITSYIQKLDRDETINDTNRAEIEETISKTFGTKFDMSMINDEEAMRDVYVAAAGSPEFTNTESLKGLIYTIDAHFDGPRPTHPPAIAKLFPSEQIQDESNG